MAMTYSQTKKRRNQLGFCQRCPRQKLPDFVYCSQCKDKVKANYKNWYDKRRAQGKCVTCGKSETSSYQCQACYGLIKIIGPVIWKDPMVANRTIKVRALNIKIDMDLGEAVRYIRNRRLLKLRQRTVIQEALCMWLREQPGFEELPGDIRSKVEVYLEHMDRYRAQVRSYDEMFGEVEKRIAEGTWKGTRAFREEKKSQQEGTPNVDSQ